MPKHPKITCPDCGGSGEIESEEYGIEICQTCNGLGTLTDDSDFTGEE